MKPAAVLAIFLLSLSLIANLVFLFRRGWTKESRGRSFCINAAVMFFAFVFVWMPLELIFGRFFIESDNFSFTLAAERWDDLYWKPLNEYKYRDDKRKDWEGKKVLFVVGDSFVAGHGIKSSKDRFSNRLADKLGDDWAVFNIAKRGWNASDEIGAIASHHAEPNRIILSYFLNDIEDAATRAGLKRPELVEEPPKLLRKLVEKSYFLNFAYWRLYRRAHAQDMIDAYAKYRAEIWQGEAVWARHRRELHRLKEVAHLRGADLSVVIFPDLFNVKETAPLTAKVAAFFQSEGVPVVDLAPRLAGRDPLAMVVSPADGHPNEKLHAEVAEILFQEFFAGKEGF